MTQAQTIILGGRMSLSFGVAKLELPLSCLPPAEGSLSAVEGNKALQKKEMKKV